MIASEELNALLSETCVERLWKVHLDKMSGYGLPRLIFGFTRYVTSTSLGDPDDFILLSNLDQCYLDEFVGRGLYLKAPMVKWAIENEGAQSWSVLQRLEGQTSLDSESRAVLDFNRAHGITAGYSISFKPVSPRGRGAIGLIGAPGMTQAEVDAIWDQHGADILLLNHITYLRVTTLPFPAPTRVLTKRQREVLGWVGDGKTVQDIALLLDRKPATVEKHLRLAREALGVETTAQAVLKAAFANQIYTS
jgi:LuxR family transcriptional regulator